MSLEELNERLHGRGFEAKDPEANLPFTPETPVQSKDLPHALGQDRDDWTKKVEPLVAVASPTPDPLLSDPDALRRKKLFFLIGGGALISLALGAFLWNMIVPFATDKVKVSLTLPQDVESNKTVVLAIRYENGNWKDMSDVSLLVTYPSSFRPEAGEGWQVSGSQAEFALGTVAGGDEGTVELRGAFHSFENQIGVFRAVLRYSPQALTSRFDVSAETIVTIKRSGVVLDVSTPLQVGNDQVYEYGIRYRNESGEPLDNMRLKIDYPEGFRFTEATPRPTEGDHLWYIGNIAVGAEGELTVRGILSGVKDDVKVTTVRLGKVMGDGSFVSFGEMERVTRIVASPLAVRQTVNGVPEGQASPGQMLNYVVSFQNEGDLGLRDLILTIDLDPTFLDLGRLQLSLGSYNQAKNQIFVRAADLRTLARLAPGERGEMKFAVPIRSDASRVAAGKSDNFVKTVARLDSPDVPTPIGANKVVASNVAEVKILTETQLNISGFYFDTTIPNTGPIPPKVGEETTYTLRASVSSSLNDLTKSQVSFLLPSNVRYIKPSSDLTETLTWNERSGELIWDVGTLVGGTERKAIFQIGLTPNESLVGETAKLLNQATFFGREEFGRRDIRLEHPGKWTSLPEDAALRGVEDSGIIVP